MSETPFIRCQKLSKAYRKGDQEIKPLQEVDLSVNRAEFLALMGPSGSGKTTLLNLIAAIDEPSSGQLWVGDTELSLLSRSQRTQWRAHHCGYIFQLYHLIPILTAFENVELPLLLQSQLSQRQRREKVLSALDLVGLSDRQHHRPTELSGGQEQRVAIARAIVTDPELIVGDEPTGDLDREAGGQILDLLERLSRDFGKTIVMVTHDPRAAERAHRTLHLDKGKLVEQQGAESPC